MKKYRIPIESYIVFKAETPEDAQREFIAIQEALAGRMRLPHDEERELFLNAQIEGKITVEEPYDADDNS